MGELGAFLKIERAGVQYEDPKERAQKLDEWETLAPKFVKVFPADYRRVLEQLAIEEEEAAMSTSGEGFVIDRG